MTVGKTETVLADGVAAGKAYGLLVEHNWTRAEVGCTPSRQ